MEKKSSEKILQTIQDTDNTILKITECIQVIRNSENKLNLMGFNSACQSYCSTPVCGYNSDSSCYSLSSKDTNINTLVPQCSKTFHNSQEVYELKEQLQNIINENQELLFKHKSITERNDLLVKALNRPAVFKKIEGCIQFPGKKEMEGKLAELKSEILRLNSEIKDVHITQLKLNSVKEILDQFNATQCQCVSPSFKDQMNTSIKVQKQEIRQIELQIKQKNNELNNIISAYEDILKTNNKITDAHNQLADGLIELLKKIEEYNLEGFKDLINDLNKNNEDIETMELIIKERSNEINDCDEKLRHVQHETKDITLKTKKLEDAMKNLLNDFNESYNKLESVYKEQLEELLALPKVLKETHIKLQEETDLRVLAEESMNKLERDIRQIESLKNPYQNDDETINQGIEDEQLKIEVENKVIESKLKSLEENIKIAVECMDKEAQELNAVNLQIQEAIAESTKHINAFQYFSEIHLERIVNDLHRLQEILTESQSRECEKVLVKKSFMDHLKDKITSINQNVESSKQEMCILLEQSNEHNIMP